MFQLKKVLLESGVMDVTSKIVVLHLIRQTIVNCMLRIMDRNRLDDYSLMILVMLRRLDIGTF